MASYYTYEAIAKKWLSFIVWKKVPKSFANSFLKQENLIKGSPSAPTDCPIWSKPHVFYHGTLASNAAHNLYFLSSDIEVLLDIITGKYTELDRKLLTPDRKKLVHENDFSSIEPVTFTSVEALNAKRAGAILSHGVDVYRQNKLAVTEYMREGKGAVLSIDIESWERDHSIILEIGWAWLQWSKTEDGQVQEAGDCQHLVMSEYLGYRNGQYTADNQQYFQFGKTRKVSLKSALKELTATMEYLCSNGAPLLLVFHNASAEIEYFAGLGIDTSSWVRGFPPSSETDENGGSGSATLPSSGIYMQDTQVLFAASGHEAARKQIGLENALHALGIPCKRMHNAGNDAFYTLAVYEALVGEGAVKEDLVEKEIMAQQNSRNKSANWGGWE